MTLFETIYDITRHECSEFELEKIKFAVKQDEIAALNGNKEIPEKIIANVCQNNGVSQKEIKSNCRKRLYADLRSIIFYNIRKNTSLSFKQIGNKLNKDHATVIIAIKKYNTLKRNNFEFQKLIINSGFEI